MYSSTGTNLEHNCTRKEFRCEFRDCVQLCVSHPAIQHAADADDHAAACMHGLSIPFGILGHRERRPGALLGPLAARPMASARRTPPLAGCQVHCVPAHARRVPNPATWRFLQTDRSSSVSQFRCLTVYSYQKTPHNLVCLLIFVLINKIGRPHQNCSMSFMSYSREILFRAVKLKYSLIVINQLFN